MSGLKGRSPEKWILKLYVYGDSPTSRNAIDNLRHIYDMHLKDRCDIKIIDLKKHPELAAKKQILAVPTLVRERPKPEKKLIGNLVYTHKVLDGLEIEKK